jgi:hypothetical protein
MQKKDAIWRLWAKALGEKASCCNNESDKIAIIRSFIFASYLITNLFICAGVIRHWNDDLKHRKGDISCLQPTKKGA